MSNKNRLSSLSSWSGVSFVTDATWGDNGKGKIVDLMADRADLVIRCNGGANAGHTVKNKYGTFKFHLIPSGIFNPKALCILSDTVVVNPMILFEEIKSLKDAGIDISTKNFLISKQAHLVMPWHKIRDQLREVSRGGGKIGTTGSGNGPVYADRTERLGLRAGDLLRPDWKQIFEREFAFQQKLIDLMQKNLKERVKIDKKQILSDLEKVKKTISPLIQDVLPIIWEKFEKGKRILGEAGQGILLDLDRGTYPFVTSSHPGIAGFNLATGLSPRVVTRVIAVTKAYTTRVGSGPFPTELKNKTGERIREVGAEYGTTTGRPRRCGWLDIPAIRYGLMAAGADCIALTKLDIFDDFEEIKLCTSYKKGQKRFEILPSTDAEFLESIVPIYETLPGWKKETKNARKFSQLPSNAQKYVRRVQKLIGWPIEIISVGPDRQESIYM